MIGILNYGSGNVQAIANIYEQLNVDYKIVNEEADFKFVSKLILPGVGAFDETMNLLNNSGLRVKLDSLVKENRTPILGICVGMQIMGDSSEEGSLKGLGWIKGTVKKFDVSLFDHKPKIPHMGWNDVINSKNHKIFNGIQDQLGFYFVHSYYFDCDNSENELAYSHYGINFSSAIFNDHIFGMQFHPEKSHINGMTLLKNFSNI